MCCEFLCTYLQASFGKPVDYVLKIFKKTLSFGIAGVSICNMTQASKLSRLENDGATLAPIAGRVSLSIMSSQCCLFVGWVSQAAAVVCGLWCFL